MKFGHMGCRSFCLKYTKRMMYFEEKYSNHSNVCTKEMYLVLSQSKKEWSSQVGVYRNHCINPSFT